MKNNLLIIFTFIVIGALFHPSNSANASPKIGTGMMKEIHRLLFSSAMEFPLPEGWKIEDYTVYATKIRIDLQSEDNQTVEVTLYHKNTAIFNGAYLGSSKSFKVFQIADETVLKEGAGAALFDRIKENDKVYFFSLHEMQVSESYFEYLIYRNSRIFFIISILLAIILFMFSANSIVRTFGEDKRIFIVMLMVFVVGAIIRFDVSPRAPIHCNTHGIREVRTYVGSRAEFYESELYGHVFPATIRKLLQLTGTHEESVFIINIVFGALGIISIFLFGLVVFKEGLPAIILASIYALAPAQVWMAGSESQMPLFHCVSFFGAAFAIIGYRNKAPETFWFGALLITYAAMLRILTILFVPVTLLFILYESNLKNLKDHRKMINHVVLWLVISGIFIFIHYKNMTNMTSKGWSESSPYAIKLFFLTYRNILWDPTLTPVFIPVTALIGSIFVIRRNLRFAALLFGVFVLIVPLTFTVLDCRTTTLRYQSPAHWIYYLLTAYIFTSEVWRKYSKYRIYAAVSLFFLLIISSLPGIAMLRNGDEEMNEYWFLRDVTKKIAAGTNIIMPVSYAIEGRMIPDFPDYMNALNPHIGIPDEGIAGDDLVYIGLDCYRYALKEELESEFTKDGIRKECSNFCGASEMETVFEKKLDARYPDIGYQDRFFYISREFPVVGFYRCKNE